VVRDVLMAVGEPEAAAPQNLAELYSIYSKGAPGMSYGSFLRFTKDYELVPVYVSAAKAEQVFALACESSNVQECGPREFAICTQMCLAIVMEVLDETADVPAGIAELAGLALNEEESNAMLSPGAPPLDPSPPPQPSPDFYPQGGRTPPSSSPPLTYSSVPTYAGSTNVVSAPTTAVDYELEALKAQITGMPPAPYSMATGRGNAGAGKSDKAPRRRPANTQRTQRGAAYVPRR